MTFFRLLLSKRTIIGLSCALFAQSLPAVVDTVIFEPLEVRLSYARAGDPSAQYNLAITYIQGKEAPKDMAQASTWLKRAAQQGLADAQFNLGVCYFNGDGVAKDPKEAVKWFRVAAQQGVFAAQKVLIRCYAAGLGIEASPAKALAWDFFARRTLELREEQPAGLPPRPAKLRPDGAAEYVTAEGRREAIFPNGSVETTDAAGVRRISAPDGAQMVIAPDGSQQTTLPNGVSENRTADGTRVVRDPQGATQTSFPDGRRLTVDARGVAETLLADGGRIVEGPAKTEDGRAVEMRQTFDKEGKLLAKRIRESDRVVETFADRSYTMETVGEEEGGGGKVIVREHFGTDGKVAARELMRADGTKREGNEEWTIKRWVEPNPGIEMRVIERYGAGNSLVKQEPLPDTIRSRRPKPPVMRPPALPTAPPVAAAAPAPTPAPAIAVAASANAINRVKRSIDPQLAELAEVARACRYYAGASDEDYEKARAEAADFMITLDRVPQTKSGATADERALAKLPPEPRLIEVPGDLSGKYPLGVHGSNVIRRAPWKHAETEHFVVHYLQNSDARPVMRIIECAYQVVTQTLGVSGSAGKKSHVFLFPDRTSWGQFLQENKLPPSVGGIAYKDELLLMANEEKNDYLKVICHEATHAIVARVYPGRRFPLWLSEGLAEYMAAKSIAWKRGHPVQRYVSSVGDRPMNVAGVLNRIGYGISGGTLTDQAGLRSFYPNSERCVRALRERLPAAAFPRFLNYIVAGNAVEPSLRAAYGRGCPNLAFFKQLVDSLEP